MTRRLPFAFALLALLVAAPALAQDAAAGTAEHGEAVVRSAEIPELPFADNPDPLLCGIPQPFGSDNAAWLNGVWEGELIRPTVFLYDSHLRREIRGGVPHGHPVEVLLSQSNPELDYYLVRARLDGALVEGWVPAPFVSFEPVAVGEG